MDTAAKLFGSSRVKVLRLFISHPDTPFDTKEIMHRAQISSTELSRELAALRGVGFIKPKTFVKEKEIRSKNKHAKPRIKRTRARGYMFDETFKERESLQAFLLNFKDLDRTALADRFKNVGKVKFFALSGTFMNAPNKERVDVTIVGDGLKRTKVEAEIKRLEAELGTPLTYAILETKDFLYRLSMYDKFVRDILDFPHERIIERISAR
jgi:hypothetical protein